MKENKEALLWVGAALELVGETYQGYYSYLTEQKDSELVLTEPVNRRGEILKGIQRGILLYFSIFIDQVPYELAVNVTKVRDKKLHVKIQKELSIVQRRSFHRVDVCLSATLQFEEKTQADTIENKQGQEEPKIKELKVLTDDLSAGGLSFTCWNREAPPAGSMLKGTLLLEGQTLLPFNAVVVRMDSRHHPQRVKVAIEFVGMPEANRQLIVKNNYWMVVNRRKE